MPIKSKIKSIMIGNMRNSTHICVRMCVCVLVYWNTRKTANMTTNNCRFANVEKKTPYNWDCFASFARKFVHFVVYFLFGFQLNICFKRVFNQLNPLLEQNFIHLTHENVDGKIVNQYLEITTHGTFLCITRVYLSCHTHIHTHTRSN